MPSFHREGTLIVVPPLGPTRGELFCLAQNLTFDFDEPSEDLLRLHSLLPDQLNEFLGFTGEPDVVSISEGMDTGEELKWFRDGTWSEGILL